MIYAAGCANRHDFYAKIGSNLLEGKSARQYNVHRILSGF